MMKLTHNYLWECHKSNSKKCGASAPLKTKRKRKKMKTINFYNKLKHVSERFMSNYCLVIGKERFEILSLSIHCKNNNEGDVCVTQRNASARPMRWFVSPFTYVRFIDIDLTSNSREGGLRIDSIQSVSNPSFRLVSCGKIYDYIKRQIRSSELLRLNGKSILPTQDSQVYLEKFEFIKSSQFFYEFPRTTGYDFTVPQGFIPNLDQRFLNLKISKTNDIKLLLDIGKDYELKKGHIPLILQCYKMNRLDEILSDLKVKDKVIYKYTDAFEIGRTLTEWEILSKYTGKQSNQKLIAELCGHFSIEN